MDACEPWGRGPGHTHPSPSLGSPCGPTWGRTMWYLPMGSGETTWHELPCPERDAGRAPIWLETTVIAHSSKPSSCCHRAGACHGLWGGTTQYSTGLHLALLPCSRASPPGCRGPGKGICAGALRIETEGTKLRKSPPDTHTHIPTHHQQGSSWAFTGSEMPLQATRSGSGGGDRTGHKAATYR